MRDPSANASLRSAMSVVVDALKEEKVDPMPLSTAHPP
jgi:hypothetical protein